MSQNLPVSLAAKAHKLCFNKLNEGIALRGVSIGPGDVRVFLRAKEWSYFSFCNLAKAACALKDYGFLLKFERREAKSSKFSYSYRRQVMEQWFSLSVQHESPICSGYLMYKIRFTHKPFCVQVKFQELHVPIGKFGNDSWLTISAKDVKTTKYQKVWQEEKAEVHMTQVVVAMDDEAANASMSAAASAAEI